jgi:hypothetical protein
MTMEKSIDTLGACASWEGNAYSGGRIPDVRVC